MGSHADKFGFVPVELLACDRHESTHLFEHPFFHVLKHILNSCLVTAFDLVDHGHDVRAITLR